MDAIARTQLRLMEGIGRQLNHPSAQTQIRQVALDHAVRHHTILARRAELLSNRYEMLKNGLSQRERELFKQAILQLETDACSESIRGLTLGTLLRPTMFTTEALLPPEVASNLRRVHRETVALIRSENFVQ